MRWGLTLSSAPNRDIYYSMNKGFSLKHRRRQSPILRKCEDLMQALWEDGYRLQIPWNVLRDYVERVCGGFRTTVTDYMGRLAIPYRSRGREGCIRCGAKKGYLERFGFIERAKNPKIVFLLHERVGRDYHVKQTNVVDFSLSLSREGEREEGAIAPTYSTTLTTTTTQRERETKPHESESILAPEEQRVLDAAKKPTCDYQPFNPNLWGSKPLKREPAP